ncbi:beta-1,3-galactosyltransferase 5-like [Tubulanus polymorphus]|uniref:beta-1,3-galactosyltransferase 5-like n=1 Tax=Tubulanus polymorphus TaxID=672921 RepID=UPI003DA438EF
MATYGDIIQINMKDVYYTLTIKTGAMVKWVYEYCRHAKYVIKIDDDMYLDAEQFTYALDARADQNAYFVCTVLVRPFVIRDPRSKFYISRETWPLPTFSNHCLGSGYGFTANAIPDIWRAALKTELIQFEDVWLTGLVARKVQDLKLVNDKRVHFLPLLKNWCEMKHCITMHGLSPENLLDIWRDKLAGYLNTNPS